MTGWFDMAGLEMNDPEDRVGFEESSARVSLIVNAEISKGVDPKKIIRRAQHLASPQSRLSHCNIFNRSVPSDPTGP